MREIEVKILEIDKEDLSDNILNLGGEQTEERVIIDTFYDYPDHRLSKRGDIVRVRNSPKEKEVAYKCGPEKSEFNIRREIETKVGDPKTMMEIIEKFGLVVVHHTEKKRTSFEVDKVKVEIDEYPEIPPFVEIEGPTEDDVKNVVEKLGFSMNDTTNLHGGQILKKYGKYKGKIDFD